MLGSAEATCALFSPGSRKSNSSTRYARPCEAHVVVGVLQPDVDDAVERLATDVRDGGLRHGSGGSRVDVRQGGLDGALGRPAGEGLGLRSDASNGAAGEHCRSEEVGLHDEAEAERRREQDG